MKNKDERGVIRSRSEPALNPNRLKDKSLAPSTSTSLAANYRNIDASYDQGESAETSCKGSDVRCLDDEDASWISWFCNQKGNEFFCEVDDDYILDDFNRSGLRNQVPFYDYALDLILDVESSNGALMQQCAIQLEKYRNYDFGRCPRIHCNKQRCLPVGQSDIPRLSTVKIYCPKCEDIYAPQSKHQDQIDGAYFGTTFPHLFFLTYGHLKPQKASQNYVRRIYGFKVHKEE
ncbi:putative casein kinase II subunit beta-4 isoform X2 [Prunus persica]|uniref:putative casein kinase II subunit beta-4 isoform X2 n=1 Tax=Prunus persica TaxID=3760 RepID=UPI0009AB2F11|nr:putative casein kinase II subunit beta-4 isoform X2 [Prunus persica]